MIYLFILLYIYFYQFSVIHPDELAERNSDLSRAMDIARGGSFETPPGQRTFNIYYKLSKPY